LTVTIRNPSGIDFLHWFVDQMKDEDVARMDLPSIQTKQVAYLNEIQDRLHARWHSDLLTDYLTFRDGHTKPRPHVNLDVLSNFEVETCSDLNSVQLRLAILRPLHFRPISHEEVKFEANGRTWEFAQSVTDALAVLNDLESHCMEELCHISTNLAEVKKAVGALWKAGIIEVSLVRTPQPSSVESDSG
jgi:hypothetical protein